MHNARFCQWLLLFFLLLTTPFFLVAQVDSGLKALEEKNMEAAWTAFQSISKEKDLPIRCYGLSRIFADSTGSRFNLDSAYYYFLKIDKAMENFSKKEKENARELMKTSVTALRRNITQQAFRQAQKTGTLAAYDHFLSYYKKADASLQAQAATVRDQLALDYAKSSNTYSVYNDVWKKYGSSIQARNPQAFLQLEKDLFDAFLKEQSWAAFSQFAADHPQHLYVKNGWKERFEQMRTTNNPVVVEQFIAGSANTPFAVIAVDSLASKLIRSDNLPACERFVKRYATHLQVKEVWKTWYETFKKQNPTQVALVKFKSDHPDFPYPTQIDTDIKASANAFYDSVIQSEDTKKQYQFIQINPKHPNVDSVWMHLFKLEQAKNPGLAGLEKFQQDYPDFPFPKRIEQARPSAIEYDYRQALKSKSQDQNLAFIAKHPTYPRLDSVWLHFFDLYQAKVTEVADWDRFKKQYPKFPFPKLVETAIAKTQKDTEDRAYRALDKNPNIIAHIDFIKQYTKSHYKEVVQKKVDSLVLKSQNIPEIEAYLQAYPATNKRTELLYHLFESYKLQKGLNGIEQFEQRYPDFPDKALLEEQKEAIRNKLYIPRRLGDKINTPQSDNAPVISADGNTLYFCSKDRKEGLGGEDIFVSQKANGEWTQAQLVKELSTAIGHEAPLAISVDGNELIIFKNGEMYSYQKTAQGWDKQTKLPATVNRSSWQSDPHITADGKALLFSSKNGSNGVDIFVALRTEEGSWGNAINLGERINTSGTDRCPFLHPDMKTLYFSSDARGGRGNLDIYVAKRLDDSWTNWSKPQSLGDTLNTSGNDWNFNVTTDGQLAYYSSGEGEDDIYEVNLPKAYQPNNVLTVDRTITSGEGKPIDGATVIVRNLTTGDTLQTLKTTPDGRLFFTVPESQQGLIGYTIQKEGVLSISDKVNVNKKEDKSSEHVKMLSAKEAIEMEAKLPINNLFFETAKYNILRESYIDLNQLAEAIQKNNWTIEIHGHTDNEGTAEDNVVLSQNRANAVRKYLIEKGCNQDRLIAIGFGETAPIDSNDTAEGRAKNRRVEIRIR